MCPKRCCKKPRICSGLGNHQRVQSRLLPIVLAAPAAPHQLPKPTQLLLRKGRHLRRRREMMEYNFNRRTENIRQRSSPQTLPNSATNYNYRRNQDITTTPQYGPCSFVLVLIKRSVLSSHDLFYSSNRHTLPTPPQHKPPQCPTIHKRLHTNRNR